MSLHPLAEGFSAVAEHYERGRPDYPPEVVGALLAELGLAPGARVLDLAAGTGKLTRALLTAGVEVVAVEPQEALREVLAAAVGAERVHAGLAEAIPLEEESVDAVTVADAFHWFDHAAALGEIARVLRPGGGLAVVTTLADWGGASWAHELGTFVAQTRPAHPFFDGPSWQEAVQESGRWTALRELRMTSTQPTGPQRIVDHLASMSWVAALPEDRRAEILARARELIEGGQTPDALPVHIVVGLTSPLR